MTDPLRINIVRLCTAFEQKHRIIARRYASAVYAVVVCLSVRLSVTSRYCVETAGRIELVFGMEASFRLSHTVL